MKDNFFGFDVSASYHGNKNWNCNPQNYNNHIITVKNKANGKSTRFEFWSSIVHPEIETRYDLGSAFRCFLDDCICGNMDFNSFCDEFGYDIDSISARKVWKACKRANEKLTRIYDGDIFELVEKMEEFA